MPPQHFCDHGLETRAGAEGTFRKGAKFGVKCRTPVTRWSNFIPARLHTHLMSSRPSMGSLRSTASCRST
ncbi:hypothetical protein Tchl_3410 [Thauera chlorobenzoica]|uniref:Uncharacterized protein n=1 Tax=Thauera chlorobenzoica TaxID=96773 RepID=A0A1L6FHS0_9RHOO|nr:hypothetical protein Tchl_3410 [Thauera chlorobenzoica]